MKVIIAGSRYLDKYLAVNDAIIQSGWQDQITEVVSGMAAGPDTFGRIWAKLGGIPVKEFPADWDTYGRSAGPRRNEQMAEYADALILIWDGKSSGSANMLKQAKAHGLKIYEHIVKVTP